VTNGHFWFCYFGCRGVDGFADHDLWLFVFLLASVSFFWLFGHSGLDAGQSLEGLSMDNEILEIEASAEVDSVGDSDVGVLDSDAEPETIEAVEVSTDRLFLDTPLNDYTVTEGLLLVVVLLILCNMVMSFFRGLF